MFRISLVALLLLGSAAGTAQADGSFLERFALAEDREEVLRDLIPGTREYYYYHCLHYQNTGQLARVDQMLAKWIDRYKSGDLLDEILYRQSVLTYGRTPQKTLDFIRQRMGLRFDHQRDTPDTRPELPDTLDPDLISRDRLTRRALEAHRDLRGFEDRALPSLAHTDLDPTRRRDLLKRLQRPDLEGMAELVVADLRAPRSGGFGSLPIHTQLLLPQLQRCAKLMPELLANAKFVNAWVVRLLPGNDADLRSDLAERDAWLTRLQQFVLRLPPNHNSLKAHVLYQRLVLDRQRGQYNEDTFLQYLKLPRQAAYMDRAYVQRADNRRFACDLNANFSAVTRMPPIGNDEPLVRDYLMNLLIRAENTAEFEPYLDDTWLRHVFAETKIVNGVGDPEKWYSLLPPDVYRQLRDRIDLEFAQTNPQDFAPDEPVALDLFVKNVPTLIVKVFEINAGNYYRDTGREVNTDIPLDGLVATREGTITYDEPPLRRVKRHLEFPELNRRGVFVIDIIGNGKASRALIRKGRVHFVTEITAAGQQFRVFNEQREPVADASVSIGGQVYEAEKDGSILVPFSTKPGRKPVVLEAGDAVTLGQFDHAAETYALEAPMYVDRESLVAGNTAELLIRPRLSIQGRPVSLTLLRDVRLTIVSTDHDGISTSETRDKVRLLEDRETVVEFAVPDRLSSLQFRLTARVLSRSLGKDVDLAAAHTVSVNQTDLTEQIVDLHAGRVDGAFVIDVLGRTGEARVGVPVQVKLKAFDFREPVTVSLSSNAAGRVTLGPLPGIESVEAALPGQLPRHWSTVTADHSPAVVVHGRAGEPVRIRTQLARLDPARVSILELRGNQFCVDRRSAARLVDGFLQLADLPAGDYQVTLVEDAAERRILVRLTEGVRVGRHVLGRSRILEEEMLPEFQIRRVSVAGKILRVQLAGASRLTRVHIFANTFRHSASPMALDPGRPGIGLTGRQLPRSRYVEGRNIGDEYRYILDRRYADKFPGNMNPRPGLLLNPWAVRGTQTGVQDAQAGDEFGAAPNDAPAASRPGMRSKQPGGDDGKSALIPSLDFLADAALVVANLVPDENGVVTLDLADLGGQQELHIVAVDPFSTVWQSHSLPERESQSRDLRLARGFDPDADYSQQKQRTVVLAGEVFRLDDRSTSRMVMYDSLRSVWQLFETLNGDAGLSEFRFVLDWPGYDEQKKRELYSRFACHELNLFLYRRDRKFFDEVVGPYLANKFEQTLVDQWLLDADLAPYVQPWRFERLNIFERIILGQRLEGQREASRRHVSDLYTLLPPDVARDERFFATALGIASLSGRSGQDNGLQAGGGLGGGGGGGGFGGMSFGVELDGPGGAVQDRFRRYESLGEKKSSVKVEDLNRKAGRGRSDPGGRALSESEALFKKPAMEQSRQLFRQVDKTQEWAESNYYHVPLAGQDSSLVSVNGFWNDYAAHDGRQPFVSAHFAEATGSLAEMLLALAVLDLPFESAEHQQAVDGPRLTLTAASPAIIVHEQIRRAERDESGPPVLVAQNFYRHDDRYRMENNLRVDKFVTQEFLVHTVYGAQVVVTNPTSTPRVLSALLQLPVGALPVKGAKYTGSQVLQLEPYATATIEYLFYFPAAGDYAHYPVHVARDGKLVAQAEAFTFHVVDAPSSLDHESWEYVSQYASADEVLDYLRKTNLNRIDLSRIAWRLREESFFNSVVDLLDSRRHYDSTVWSYSVVHNQARRLSQFLSSEEGFVSKCGLVLQSPLLRIDPVERGTWQQLEYKPLVNARAHQLGPVRRILNDRLKTQYELLMSVLSQRNSLSDRERLAVTYYLLLQDRVGEALSHFRKVDAEHLTSHLQHDYFAAYLDFYSEGLDVARRIVAKYADYPVVRWRDVFAGMAKQIGEVDGGGRPDPDSVDPRDRDAAIAALAAADCSFDVSVESANVKIEFENLEEIRVNYYLMDVELLFSQNPFVKQHSGQFAYVKPNRTQTLRLPASQKILSFELPQDLQNQNVMIEVTARGKRQSAAYYSNSMSVQLMENYGQLRVAVSDGKMALPGVYVKAYARMKDGSVKFYKDGYADLRGRFDYASLSTNALDNVDRFSLLILSDSHGATVREIAPPAR